MTDETAITQSQTRLAEFSERKITFYIDDKEMLALTADGFIYNGQVITDAGEAHRLFTEWIKLALKAGRDETPEA